MRYVALSYTEFEFGEVKTATQCVDSIYLAVGRERGE